MSALKFILPDVTLFLPDNESGLKAHYIQVYMIGPSLMKELNVYLLIGNGIHRNESNKFFSLE